MTKQDLLAELDGNVDYDGLKVVYNEDTYELSAYPDEDGLGIDIDIYRDDELQSTIYSAYKPAELKKLDVAQTKQVFAGVNEKIADAILEVAKN
ncbi:hypothetical protein [Weissella halotolerans]|uniref:Uncharacterized protein n=1 Tax=Weissella halotolerans DSM 20190 TaxID=1123500 RepID=A0A0R2G706_9LACO|nr:hypothetical protein [Weissella halotolerans]KRN32500.1 hypothetical protein IV68_GL000855 [Weissella halotolerans DSM 20190]